ncbi:MAG: NfeD family protein, partial [Dehalococcoidia bacterium]
EEARLLIIKLDTPGGLLSSTEKIVQLLFNARVPTAVYVYPSGAFAASAGTFVTTAANFAVMSEGSSIGAAAPVGAGGENLPETLSEKAVNITVAMVEGIAEKRGRNRELLISTVTEARAFSATEAVDEGIVDFIATDIDDLLARLDGRTVETAAGTVVLDTKGLAKREIDMSLAERFFSFVGDPNIIGLLITLGALGIFVELLHPGLIVPGVTGLLALVVGLVALGTLPFNWAGIALLALAAVLIFFEIQAPGFGFLGLAGVIAFIIGALLLFSVGEPSFPGAPVLKISLWLLGILSAMMALFALVVVTAVARSRRLKYVSALAKLVGQRGRVTSDLSPTGTVQVASELWSAVSQSEEVISQGEEVEVVEVKGLTLKVRKG